MKKEKCDFCGGYVGAHHPQCSRTTKLDPNQIRERNKKAEIVKKEKSEKRNTNKKHIQVND